ncbi:M20/M25/M40 family metallo-hydrolase [Limnovirga soli]|uniref:Carboxypeptidase Q n=1 Tax=Limnovirga soli TaxID=2656915 RepID=A0A8J8FJL7_9BACT|nr:M20/M25/M40 family metallo-hydrolase [Limnovirga soli]NNV57061.1 M20/M25/M40 family metallo-hydrolase [Limnovirga soli]
MKKICFLLFALPVAALAQQTQNYTADSVFIKTISDNIMVSRAAYNNLFYLTKKIGGRLAGSPQMVQAENWGYSIMDQSGADKVSMQECMVPHWVRGGKDKATVSFTAGKGKIVNMPLNVLALGNSEGSGPKGVTAPVIRVNSFDELEKRKSEIKGKIVFYNVPFEETFIKTFQSYGKNVMYRGAGASRAAKYGAVAVMVRSMTHAMDNNPHTGAMNYADSLPKIPAVAVGLRDVEKLDSLLDNNTNITAQIFTYGKMLPDTIGHNIIGELTGTEYPNEIITVGGHLDSWDVNEGAHDDGAGIIQTIEVLRVFAALGFKPKHTIRFVLFANEENGTRGGKQYAAVAKEKNEKHIFALESDEGGFTPRGFGFDVNTAVWSKLNSWKPLFTPYGGDGFTQGGGGADIGYLKEAFKTPMAGLQPDSQRYFDVHHAASDVFESVNIRELKLGAVNMAALLYLVDKYGL